MIPPSVCDVLPPHSGCDSSYRRPVALRPEIRPDRAGHGSPVPRQQPVEGDAITYAFQQLKNNPCEALQIAERQLAQPNNPHLQLRVLALKSRALLKLQRHRQCLSFINDLPRRLQVHKELCLSKGGALQELKRPAEALDVFRRLYDQYATNPKDEKIYGLAMVRVFQNDGRPAQLREALHILKRLRRRAANNRDDTPCHDREIELALGRHLEIMGGNDNLQACLLYTSPSPRDRQKSRMPSSA